MTLGPNTDDSHLYNFLKGGLVGSSLIAGLYGVNILKDSILDMISKDYNEEEDKESFPNSLYPKRLYIEKKGFFTEPLVYGVGLPVGALITKELIDRGERTVMMSKLKKKFNKLFNTLTKNSEINSFVDGYVDHLEKRAIDPDTAIDFLLNSLPVTYGALAGTGALSGYYLAKEYFNNGSPMVEAPIKQVPVLMYNIKKKKGLEKKSEWYDTALKGISTLSPLGAVKDTYDFAKKAPSFIDSAFDWTANKFTDSTIKSLKDKAPELLKEYAPHLTLGTLAAGMLFSAPTTLSRNSSQPPEQNNNNVASPPPGDYKKFEMYKGIG